MARSPSYVTISVESSVTIMCSSHVVESCAVLMWSNHLSCRSNHLSPSVHNSVGNVEFHRQSATSQRKSIDLQRPYVPAAMLHGMKVLRETHSTTCKRFRKPGQLTHRFRFPKSFPNMSTGWIETSYRHHDASHHWMARTNVAVAPWLRSGMQVLS